MPDWLDDFRQRGEEKLSLPPAQPPHAGSLPAPTLRVLARLQEHFVAKGYRAWEADTLALATLGELMQRKGGPVALTEEVEVSDELGKAIRLVQEVFGPEIEREPA